AQAMGQTTPVLVGSAQVDANHNYLVQVGSYFGTPPANAVSSLPEGTFVITAEELNFAGGASPMSAPTTPNPVIDLRLPKKPTLKLDPASDTGTPGDNITAAAPQVFDGTADSNTTVQIRDGSTVIDTFTQSGTSTTFQRTLNLAPGVHILT